MLINKDLFNQMFDSLMRNIKYLNDNLANLNIYILIVLNKYNELKEKQIMEILSRYNYSFLNIRIIKSRYNLGYAPSVYLAYVLTRSHIDYYIIMNDDIIIPYDKLIYSLLEHMEKNDKIIAISPKILSLNNPTRYDYAGAAGFYIDVLLTPFADGRLNDLVLRNKEPDNQGLDCSVFMPSGAFVVVKNSEESIPDPILFITFEEADIGIKALCKNYIICFDKSNYVYHKGSSTIGSIYSARRIFYIFRNRILLVIKYSNIRLQLLIIPLMFLHDLIATIYLSTINKSMILSFVKAWINVFRKYRFYRGAIQYNYVNCFSELLQTGKIHKVPINIHYAILRIKYWRKWKNILQSL